jgi:acrylyl-CoA reductase (NADPH)
MKHETAVSAIGNAGDSSLPTTVIPFLLRGIKLIGIDSASKAIPKRIRAWERLSRDLPSEKLSLISTEISLLDTIQAGKDILVGNTFGRLVVNVKDAS